VHELDGSAFRECFSLSWRNPYVLRLAFSAGIGGLLFGYDTGGSIVIESLPPVQKFFHVSSPRPIVPVPGLPADCCH
jgi:hypothetical protein